MKVFCAIAVLVALTGLCSGETYANAPKACPNIITRAQWGARAATTSGLSTVPPPYVLIHHAASGACTTKDACIRLVKSFQNMHIDVNGWADIGYNFLVGEDGNIYEGRGWGKTGAHAPNYNSKSIGICVIGDFTSRLPNAVALQNVHNLIACGVSTGKIHASYKLAGHRQVSATACPGDTLYKHITTWAHWTAKP